MDEFLTMWISFRCPPAHPGREGQEIHHVQRLHLRVGEPKLAREHPLVAEVPPRRSPLRFPTGLRRLLIDHANLLSLIGVCRLQITFDDQSMEKEALRVTSCGMSTWNGDARMRRSKKFFRNGSCKLWRGIFRAPRRN